eukprot:15242627-Ditylum_brightwellii.AAC.1
MIHTRAFQVGVTPVLTEGGGQTMQTIAGAFTTNREVQVPKILLPEFSRTKQVDGIAVHLDTKVAMRPTLEWDDIKTVDNYFALFDKEVDDDEMENELFTSEIKDAKYGTVTPEEMS